MHVCMVSCFSRVQLSATLGTVAHQATLSMGFSRPEYWNGLPWPPSGDLPNPGIQTTSLMSPALAGRFFTVSASWEAHNTLLCGQLHLVLWLPLEISNHQPPNGQLLENLPPKLSVEDAWLGAGSQGFFCFNCWATFVNLLRAPTFSQNHSDACPRGPNFLFSALHPCISTMIFLISSVRHRRKIKAPKKLGLVE